MMNTTPIPFSQPRGTLPIAKMGTSTRRSRARNLMSHQTLARMTRPKKIVTLVVVLSLCMAVAFS